MLDQELETRIAAWLREQWGVEEENGCFYTELFADYRDELGKRDLQAIADSDDPREAFYDWLNDAYEDEVDQAWFNLVSKCADDLEIEHETAWEFLTEGWRCGFPNSTSWIRRSMWTFWSIRAMGIMILSATTLRRPGVGAIRTRRTRRPASSGWRGSRGIAWSA